MGEQLEIDFSFYKSLLCLQNIYNMLTHDGILSPGHWKRENNN